MKFEVVTSDFILDFLRYLPLLKHITHSKIRYDFNDISFATMNLAFNVRLLRNTILTMQEQILLPGQLFVTRCETLLYHKKAIYFCLKSRF